MQGVYAEEFIDAKSGHAKHLRRMDEHPITLAYHRGKFGNPASDKARDRRSAADKFRMLYELRARTGTDCTIAMSGGHGSSGTPWTQIQADAIYSLTTIRDRMHRKDFVIVEKFCGEGYSMVDAVRAANVPFHANGVVPRVCEALDDLVAVISGRRIVFEDE